MQFESKRLPLVTCIDDDDDDDDDDDETLAMFIRAVISDCNISASLADRNLRARCWFILARGAVPSTAR